MPSLHLAEAHTGRTYVYELTWPAPGMGGILGACHGLDVPLVFGKEDASRRIWHDHIFSALPLITGHDGVSWR